MPEVEKSHVNQERGSKSLEDQDEQKRRYEDEEDINEEIRKRDLDAARAAD